MSVLEFEWDKSDVLSALATADGVEINPEEEDGSNASADFIKARFLA